MSSAVREFQAAILLSARSGMPALGTLMEEVMGLAYPAQGGVG